MRLWAAALLVVAVVATAASAAPSAWETRAPMPLPRTEVSAAVVGNEIVVLGGFTIDGGASRRVDAYSPARDTWRRLPDLPIGVHHAMAVGAGGKPYVLGGYTVTGATLRAAFVLENGAWRSLPRMPFPRAAAGAGVAGGRIVVAGGIGEGRRLARNALAFDLRTRRWSVVPGPTPREHLGVTSLGGNRLRGRRSHGRPRHEPPALRELPTRRPQVAPAAAGSRSAGRNRRGRARRARDLGRRRGAGRHDRGGARVPDRRAALGAAREPADTEARRRSCGARRSRLRHRGRARAWSHRELGQRVARDRPVGARYISRLRVPGERQRREAEEDRDPVAMMVPS